GTIEQPQVIVDFRNRPDGRSRAARSRLLLNGNGGAQPIDGIDIGALHLVKELASIRGEGFDVASLAFRVDGVEGQRRLARTAEAGDDGEFIAGNLDAHVGEIMRARPVNNDAMEHKKSIPPSQSQSSIVPNRP